MMESDMRCCLRWDVNSLVIAFSGLSVDVSGMPTKNKLSRMLLDCKSNTVSLSCLFSDVMVDIWNCTVPTDCCSDIWFLDRVSRALEVIGNMYGVLQ